MREFRPIKTLKFMRIRRALWTVLAVLCSIPAFADDVANSEAIRVEIENLRATGRLSIGGVDIATGNTLARFYERREFSPTWTDLDQSPTAPGAGSGEPP